MRLLLGFGASTEIRNSSGQLPVHFSFDKNIRQLLQSKNSTGERVSQETVVQVGPPVQSEKLQKIFEEKVSLKNPEESQIPSQIKGKENPEK